MKTTTVVAAGFASLALAACGGQMTTSWGEKVTSENCWRSYPRPQMVREGWTNLNGNWDYAVARQTAMPTPPDGF